MTLSLRQYQQDGADGVRLAFREQHRAVLLVLTTGGGKTYIFCYIADSACRKGNPVLILVHRQELLMQASMSLASMGISHGLIAQDKNIYEIMRQQQDEIGSVFINQDAGIMVASVDTVINRLSTIRKPRLVICDEAHHLIDENKWGRVVAHFPDSKVLGVTATPIRGDGRGLGAHCGGIFTKIVMGPTTAELIQMGYLVPTRYFAPPNQLDLSQMKRSNRDYNKTQLGERVDKPVITGSVVDHYKKNAMNKAAIAFCVSVKHAEHVAADFRANGVRSYSIDGTMHNSQRRGLLRGLAERKIDVLTSCDIVSEGTDIPLVEVGILLRPTLSTGLFLQQIGRCLRISEGKSTALILDHVGNYKLHGFPEDDREWTLDGAKKRGKKGEQEKGPRTAQCEKCFACFVPQQYCPECGAATATGDRTIEEVAGELQEIQRATERREALQAKFEVRKAQTLEELIPIGKARGYPDPVNWGRAILHSRKKKEHLRNMEEAQRMYA